MQLTIEFIEELELLNLYNLNNTQEGLKIHHEASPSRIEAARRLFEKNIITLADGGYLTPLGKEAASHTQELLTMLNITPPK